MVKRHCAASHRHGNHTHTTLTAVPDAAVSPFVSVAPFAEDFAQGQGGSHRQNTLSASTGSKGRVKSTATASTSTVSKNSKSSDSGSATSTSDFQLSQSYTGSTFLDGWTFFTGPDPTHGSVQFLDASAAKSAGLAKVTNGNVILAVDHTTNVGSTRKSVRITSTKTFNQGDLLLGDFLHAPVGCSVWPAFWTVGSNWPDNGEIDILEGVNLQTTNQMTLHTSSGCTLGQPMQATGKVVGTNCDASVNGNAGCGVSDPRTSSYGKGFNSGNGGVFATLWDNTGIKIWFFPRTSIPSDITSGSPDPRGWNEPVAFWDTKGCDTNSHFGPQNIVFDITLNGDWAGAVLSQDGCSGSVSQGSDFTQAYFEIQYVKVFTGPKS